MESFDGQPGGSSERSGGSRAAEAARVSVLASDERRAPSADALLAGRAPESRLRASTARFAQRQGHDVFGSRSAQVMFECCLPRSRDIYSTSRLIDTTEFYRCIFFTPLGHAEACSIPRQTFTACE